MSVRIYVVIVLFWALLTAVTPTLVRLAASANLYSRLDGDQGREGVKLLMLPRKALAEAIVSIPVTVRAPALAEANGGISDGEDAIVDKFRSNFDRS